MATHEYRFEITEDEEGGYVAQCVQIPGVITQGETLEAMLENAWEALEAMRESRALREVPIGDGRLVLRSVVHSIGMNVEMATAGRSRFPGTAR